jgi:hypothetical protein
LQAAAKAVDVPGHHHIELTPDGGLVERIECRSTIATLSAADAVVLVDVDDLPTGPLGNLAKLPLLVGCGLIER